MGNHFSTCDGVGCLVRRDADDAARGVSAATGCERVSACNIYPLMPKARLMRSTSSSFSQVKSSTFMTFFS